MIRILSILTLILITSVSYAQSFRHMESLSLSQGAYSESHDEDSIIQIGSALYNVRTSEVVGVVFVEDTIGEELEDELMGRWLAIDQLHYKYASLNPYNFTGCSPIKNIDPDGKQITSASDYSYRVVEAAIYSVFKSADIAHALFNFNDNPKVGDKDNSSYNKIKTHSFTDKWDGKRFKKELKQLAKDKSTDDNKIKFSSKEIKAAYKLYMLIDEDEEHEVLVTNSKQVVNQGGYEASTDENNETSRKVETNLSRGVMKKFSEIEERCNYTNKDETCTYVNADVETQKEEYLDEKTNNTDVLNDHGNVLINDNGSTDKGENLLKQELVK